jgi:hypothetical protein
VGTIGEWTEERLWNFVRLRLSQVPDNTRGLISRAINGIITAPPGQIGFTARSTVPDGWLAADGTDVSRSDFAALFDAIGTTYGVGDGSTTFTLPDYRGRVLVGVGSNAAINTVTDHDALVEASRTPIHQHFMDHKHDAPHTHSFSVSGTTGTDGAGKDVADDPHTHNYPGGGGANTTGNNSAAATVARHSHDHNFSDSGNTGGFSGETAGPHDALGNPKVSTDGASMPYHAALAIIKT